MFTLPSTELQALFDLYDFTGGDDWKWLQPYSENGIKWVYGNYSANPCTESWQGVVCTTNCTVSPCNVQEIELYSRNLMGSLPQSLSNLTYLQLLDLYDNHLTGEISVYCSLKQIVTAITGVNLFDSTIPACLGDLTHINSIYLNFNMLTGTLPPELSHAVSLSLFYLEYNPGIYGNIPSEWGSLTNLNALDISYCQLYSSLPISIGNMIGLYGLYLTSNFITGSIPSSIGQMMVINEFELNVNYFDGYLPAGGGYLIRQD